MIRELFKHSQKSKFARNAFTLTIGTSIAQFLPMLFYPILGRIYSPEEFGLLATLISITSILAVLASAKYEDSILIARTNNDAANIISLVILLSLSFLLISAILLQLVGKKMELWLNEPNLNKWLFICSLSAFSIIVFRCYNEWCVRNQYFKSLSWNKIVNSAAITLGKLFFGFVNLFSAGLVVGDLLGRIISAGSCFIRGYKQDKSEFYDLSLYKMQLLAKQFKKFPIYILPAELLSTIGGSLPVFMIGAYFNSAEVGYYAMTMNLLSIPISVISRALRDVFRQRANEEYIKTGKCVILYLKLFRILLISSTIGSLIIVFVLPTIFIIVLGGQWRSAGEYSQILLPMMAIDFISISLSGILLVTQKMKIEFFWQLYYFGITITSLLVGALVFQDIRACLISFSIGRSTAYLLYIYLSYKYSKGDLKNAKKS